MSCFVFVVLAEGLGFLSFLGVVLACPSCFLGLLGFSVFLVRSAPVVGVGGGLRGVPGFGVWRARVVRSSSFCWGAGLGCVCARPVVLLVVWFWLWSGPVVGGGCVRVARFPWWGSGCARFPVRVRGVVVVFAGGFRVLFFPSGALCFLLVSGVGLRGLAGGWGVVGGVGLGWGCFFSGFCCTGPGLFGFGLGFVWRV